MQRRISASRTRYGCKLLTPLRRPNLHHMVEKRRAIVNMRMFNGVQQTQTIIWPGLPTSLGEGAEACRRRSCHRDLQDGAPRLRANALLPRSLAAWKRRGSGGSVPSIALNSISCQFLPRLTRRLSKAGHASMSGWCGGAVPTTFDTVVITGALVTMRGWCRQEPARGTLR